MIAKTVTGADFTGALAYGAGLRSDRANKQSELLSLANIGSHDPHGIAAEMRAVAEMSSRIQLPVWHTILSWAPGEVVDREQKLKAAALYCELMGASLERHQVAVYEHQDKQHPHLHIYINRVPMDGGPALRSDQNYVRNVLATRQIRQQLGMAPLPERQQKTKDLDPNKEVARGHVRNVLAAALQDEHIRSLDQLVAHLQKQAIETHLKQDGKGVLVGTSFRYAASSVKGTEVGIKAKQLRDHFRPLRSEAQRTQDLLRPGEVVSQRSFASATLGNEFDDINGLLMDDAERNENENRRRRRPRL
ncbi:relaxase/mobilization nuclease domain-containing protein [Hymenobacter volaticus]|uniref:Relaxase/mobilization nuclease domain-containing protein n=1 Tax=Hymenobacter volaticus TaxID=2932254 RepID=A0ABY4GGK9_9BACT|nr:relaxase/mobilization nuclease domain-containing protein [Hymenobacter volaticus]UOQ69429.1 relaxase/mobilization nuclease domain-containing protein [Hymenobacter volaticus]